MNNTSNEGGALLGINHSIFFVICSSCCRCAIFVIVVVVAVVVSLLLLAKTLTRKYRLQEHMRTTLSAIDHTPSPSFNLYDLPSHPPQTYDSYGFIEYYDQHGEDYYC